VCNCRLVRKFSLTIVVTNSAINHEYVNGAPAINRPAAMAKPRTRVVRSGSPV
jgi:hypothetical protein